MIRIAVIGGSGLDNPEILKNSSQKAVKTPYGNPSGPITIGKINNCSVAILPRHGPDHQIPPSLIPYQANIWALKEIGCTHILATTACGSLKEEIKPGDLIFVDQFIDHTKYRKCTFFENRVVHTPMAQPFDSHLRQMLIDSATKLGISYHPKGTIITIEGPRFSTKAESLLFRQWGADLINMSTVPEVVLANEVSLPYQTIAMSTDYDCWRENEEPVTFEIILKRMKENSNKVINLLKNVISHF